MKNRIFISLLLSTVVATGALAQSVTSSLNDGWSFSKDQVNWQQVCLPHTWNTDAYSTTDYAQGAFTYKRTLRLPQLGEASMDKKLTNATSQHYFLKLEAASKTSTIYINDKKVGEHKGGYTAAVFDLTPYLDLSSGKVNELKVVVDNATQHVTPISADFTFMGGIYRNVKLITTEAQHFSMTEDGSDGVFVCVSNVSDSKASISVKSRLRNEDAKSKTCYLVNSLYAPDGKVVSVTKKQVRLGAGQTLAASHELPQVKNPVLWTPETPSLYRVRTELVGAKLDVIDSQDHYVGMRWCEFDAEKGFFLNGKSYKLNGMCRHQDQAPYGVALDDDMHRQDFRTLKEMGCNFVRLAHYPQAEAVLEMCDKLGLLVWEEIPVINFVPDDDAFADNAADQLREMIRQHYNHPSVILWGYMNEILLRVRERYPKQADYDKAVGRIMKLAERLDKIVREEDTTRHSCMALHGTNDYNKLHIADIPQVIGWNLYQGWYSGKQSDFDRYVAEQHRDHPTHPFIITEWGAGSDLRLHTQQGEAFDFSCEYQQKYIEHYLPVINREKYVLGGTYWNFVDFSSASRAESMSHINNKGVLTADRRKKDVFYYFQADWRKDIPVLHIATRDWQKRETFNALHPIKVYTNADKVSLTMDGRNLGEKTVENHFAVFDVTLKEGDNHLVAQATVNGKQVEDYDIVTWNQPTEIAVNVGSHCYFQSDKTGVTWQPDQAYQEGSWGYIGGKSKTTQSEIKCTDDGPLYQTMREGIEGYRFDVPAGRYELELLLADIHKQQAQSVYLLGKDSGKAGTTGAFSVVVNGKMVERDWLPGLETGFFTAIRRSYLVEAKDSHIEVKFVSADGKAMLSGIKLRRL